jgi:hypothetical protein
VVGEEQWAQIRRMFGVERLAVREISRRTGLRRRTIRRAVSAPLFGVYGRRATDWWLAGDAGDGREHAEQGLLNDRTENPAADCPAAGGRPTPEDRQARTGRPG